MMWPARIARAQLPESGRIIAISDIHGNLPYLRGLLGKLALTEEDTLVFCGDMVEKGPQSLATLRYIMDLAKKRRVLAVQGNCDCWQEEIYRPQHYTEGYLRRYFASNGMGWGPGLLAQMCEEIGFPLSPEPDVGAMRAAIAEHFRPELDFIDSLPHVLDTEHYTFVHGGLPEGDPAGWDGWECMKNDNFMRQGRKFDKWVIVGHWPVVLYGGDITCADPLIDRESHIVSIDGGCVLKDDGQLNALIIPRNGSEDFGCVYYDPFPLRRVKTAQAASQRSAYIRWGDNVVEVLERGEEFPRCRHLRTGYELDILTKYLRRGSDGAVRCNDCTDYALPLAPGDEVGVVEATSRGFLCKHNGVSGWYFGELEDEA